MPKSSEYPRVFFILGLVIIILIVGLARPEISLSLLWILGVLAITVLVLYLQSMNRKD